MTRPPREPATLPNRTAPRGLLALAFVLASAVVLAPPGGAQGPDRDDGETTTSTAPPRPTDPGLLARVTAAGEVVVSRADGSEERVVGRGAVANASGLTPLAWRSPAADSIAYVRDDGALMVARVDGGGEVPVATDAIVPAYADEQLLSWDISGTFLSYIGRSEGGAYEAKVADFSEATPEAPAVLRPVGNSDRRVVVAQGFSPIDPIMWQRTVDSETNREFTLALVEPFNGNIVGTPFEIDDPTISADGRYLVGVSRLIGGEEAQLVRVRLTRPRIEPIFDHPSVCRPSVSPDVRKVVFAAGERCDEIWVIGIDGSAPTRISDRVDDRLDYRQGRFSWSLDSRVISHAACRGDGDLTNCGGPPVTVSVDGKTVTRGPESGSVLWEQRPLIRPIHVTMDITGPIRYLGRMVVSADSVGDFTGRSGRQVLNAISRDDEDPERFFQIRLTSRPDTSIVAGGFRVVDGEFDERVTLFGRAALASYGSARIRGVWIHADRFPLRAGQIVVNLDR